MSNQTARQRRATRPAPGTGAAARRDRAAAPGGYRRQTARGGVGALRDGKPLISVGPFGWGGDLTRLQKARIVHRAANGFWAFVIVAVVGVLVFGVLQQNVFIPNQSIVSVNGVTISQDTFRKELAFQAQTLWNRLQSEITQQQVAASQASGGNQNASNQSNLLIGQIQADESSYAQAAITQASVDRLVEDQLIQKGIGAYEAQHVPAAKFAVTDKAVNDQLSAFKKAFPRGETYGQFLSADGLSNDDVLTAIRIEVRRNALQAYLSSLLTTPTKQVHLRRIEVNTLAQANTIRAKLAKNNTDQEWATLAKQDSLDPNTKTVGGDMGWNFWGNFDGVIENWAYGPGVKVNALSPVIKDVGGTYNVVQLLGVDPSRPVDASQLSSAKTDALNHWLNGARAEPANRVGNPNQDMLTATRNMPVKPDLNATLPTFNTGTPQQG
jgi:hypothetical protein